jgi:hypothetical protein
VAERRLTMHVMIAVPLLHFSFVVFSLTNTQDWTIKIWTYGMNMKEERSMVSSR